MKEILITTIPTIITAVLTFILTRRKYVAELQKERVETESTEIDNVEKAARIWRELSEGVTSRLNADIQQLRKENRQTREKIQILSRENNALRIQMYSLQKELQHTKIENEKLTEQLRAFNLKFSKENIGMKPLNSKHYDRPGIRQDNK